jgi:hypothetical protein
MVPSSDGSGVEWMSGRTYSRPGTGEQSEGLRDVEDLRFEYAAQLRDELRELRRDLREIQAEEAPAGEVV